MCGYDDHSLPPVRGGGNQGYQTGCHFAVLSALTAILVRDATGEGQHCDVNMHAAANVTTEYGSYGWLVAGETALRQTGRHAGLTMTMETQIQCADGHWVNTGVPPRIPREFGSVRDWILELGLEDEFPLNLDEPELRVVPNDRRINTAGIDRSTLGSTIRAYTGGLYAGEYFDGNQRMDMLIRTETWQSPEELLSLPIATPLSGVQKIGDLVSLDRAVGPTRLQRVDGRRTVTLNVIPPEEVTLEEALEKLQAVATPAIKAELPASASVKYRGNADRLKQALTEISQNFLFALAILFMIMAALFKSIRDSLLVLLVMPVAVAGGLAGLKLLNLFTFQSLDMLTMIGFIILLGLVVNNAILLVDQTRRAEREGATRKDAVKAAIRIRARPIFMSTLTSIFGMMPLMLMPGVGSEIYRGLATVIVGGMIASGFLTLILMPGLLRLEANHFFVIFQGGLFRNRQQVLSGQESLVR